MSNNHRNIIRTFTPTQYAKCNLFPQTHKFEVVDVRGNCKCIVCD